MAFPSTLATTRNRNGSDPQAVRGWGEVGMTESTLTENIWRERTSIRPVLFAGLLSFLAGHASAFDEGQTKAACAADWPGDFQMQAYCVRQQRAGHEELQHRLAVMPSELGPAAKKCEAEWGSDWQMQAYCLEQQQIGYAGLPNVLATVPAEVAAVIGPGCAADWPDDYQMRTYCAERQVAGWKALNN